MRKVLAVIMVLFSITAFAQDKPNIVLILMDNLGWGEVGAYGGGVLRGAPTPRIDALASEGMQLLNFNVEAQCTPSRAAIMTGRYAVRTGNGSIPIETRFMASLSGKSPWLKCSQMPVIQRVCSVSGILGTRKAGIPPIRASMSGLGYPIQATRHFGRIDRAIGLTRTTSHIRNTSWKVARIRNRKS